MPLIGNDARLAKGAWAGKVHLRDRLQARSAAYLLGTVHVGRDLLSRLIHAVRLSLTVGLAATALNVVAAVLIGGTAGSIGGRLTW